MPVIQTMMMTVIIKLVFLLVYRCVVGVVNSDQLDTDNDGTGKACDIHVDDANDGNIYINLLFLLIYNCRNFWLYGVMDVTTIRSVKVQILCSKFLLNRLDNSYCHTVTDDDDSGVNMA